MEATLYYQPQAKKAGSKRVKIGITRGQAILYTLLLGIVFYLMGSLMVGSVNADTTQYKVVTVKAGESVWQLATEHSQSADADIREIVDHIIEVNGLENVLIYPGQSLKIPVRN
ncbi:cell division suppressor protein YneA [Brevibacillus sp. SYSU BS000544]|uniref:cell division suppressor protein YneA n=1 Tax=Brevibacillus sp. SYSU BS000544 TaxID=3416443 RepID=UPI003CE5A87C